MADDISFCDLSFVAYIRNCQRSWRENSGIKMATVKSYIMLGPCCLNKTNHTLVMREAR